MRKENNGHLGLCLTASQRPMSRVSVLNKFMKNDSKVKKLIEKMYEIKADFGSIIVALVCILGAVLAILFFMADTLINYHYESSDNKNNKIEYSGEYFIASKSGSIFRGLELELEDESSIEIWLPYTQGSLYCVGDTITCSFTKEENSRDVDNFVVTNVFTVQDKVDSGSYMCYYNGQKVEPGTIDISMYEYKVNNEKHVVYLTDKQSR